MSHQVATGASMTALAFAAAFPAPLLVFDGLLLMLAERLDRHGEEAEHKLAAGRTISLRPPGARLHVTRRTLGQREPVPWLYRGCGAVVLSSLRRHMATPMHDRRA